MSTSTKIVCTIGPAVTSSKKIENLITAGMNVARLNFSHGTHEEHARTIDLLKAAREKASVPLAIMLDTKGPEMRLGELHSGQIELKENQTIRFVKEEVDGDEKQITLKPASVIDELKKNMIILLDDGYIITHVTAVDERGVEVKIDHGGGDSINPWGEYS